MLGTVALLGADYASKQWATGALSEERAGTPPPVCAGQGMQRMHKPGIVLVDGYFELQYAENCGAAFGLLREADDTVRRVIFGVAAAAAAIALMWMFVVGRGGKLFAWSVPFVVSGALGNLVDRIRYGYVVDFIRFHVHDSFEYPTFNVADITIVIGVALLVIDGMRKDDGKKALAKTSDEAEPSEARTEKRKKRAKKSEDRSAAEG
jgi:signal peptidase II